MRAWPAPLQSVLGGASLAGAELSTARHLATSYANMQHVLSALRQGMSADARMAAPAAAEAASRSLPVKWRDSSLTRWLQPRLQQAVHVVVFAALLASPEAAADTLSTLSYVSRMRSASASEGVVVSATWEDASLAAAAPPSLQGSKLRRTILQIQRRHGGGWAQIGGLPGVLLGKPRRKSTGSAIDPASPVLDAFKQGMLDSWFQVQPAAAGTAAVCASDDDTELSSSLPAMAAQGLAAVSGATAQHRGGLPNAASARGAAEGWPGQLAADIRALGSQVEAGVPDHRDYLQPTIDEAAVAKVGASAAP
jgi:hypothetical protein